MRRRYGSSKKSPDSTTNPLPRYEPFVYHYANSCTDTIKETEVERRFVLGKLSAALEIRTTIPPWICRTIFSRRQTLNKRVKMHGLVCYEILNNLATKTKIRKVCFLRCRSRYLEFISLTKFRTCFSYEKTYKRRPKIFRYTSCISMPKCKYGI